MDSSHHPHPPISFQPPTGPDSPQFLPPDNFHVHQATYPAVSFMKGPKRKRLAKACDPCHRSKRRCDGTEPCGNCQWANKPCCYTDQAGRRVPPPNPPMKFYNPDDPSDANPYPRHSPPSVPPYPSDHPLPGPHPYATYGDISSPAAGPSNPPPPPPPPPPDHDHSRKRFKGEFGPAPPPTTSTNININNSNGSSSESATFQLDHTLVLELTSLFFAHFPIARTIIHKPDFSRDLESHAVPMGLVFSICAVAAPFSRREKIRTNPPRLSGRPFAQEALSLLFDGAGRLIQEKTLATAQTLCLMQLYEMMSGEVPPSPMKRYHQLALQILDQLGLMRTDHARLTPSPSRDYVNEQIGLECLRRVFWFIQFLDIWVSVFYQRPATITDRRLQLRLPHAETCFEMGVTNILPEFLTNPPVKAVYSSEFGHLIRIATIYYRIETALREIDVQKREQDLFECNQQLREWHTYLTDELKFEREMIEVHKSMLVTGSSTGAWCFFHIHVMHASCELALAYADLSSIPAREASANLISILNIVGEPFLKSSFLLASAAWTLRKYGGRDDSVMKEWCRDIQDTLGLDICQYSSFVGDAPPGRSFVSSKGSPSCSGSGGSSSVSHRPSKATTMMRRARHDHDGTGSESTSGGGGSRPGSTSPRAQGRKVEYHSGIIEGLGMEESGCEPTRSTASSPTSLPSLKLSGLLETGRSGDPSPKARPRRCPTPPRGLAGAATAGSCVASMSEKQGAPIGLDWLKKDH